MRTIQDRIHHTLGFKVIGLLIFVPLASWLFGYNLQPIATIIVAGSIIATVWNFSYNLLFDYALLRLSGELYKTVPLRVLHAFLFQGGLLLLFLPMIAWYLGITLWEALMMDMTMATFYLVHAFVYNWVYDKAYPIQKAGNSHRSKRSDILNLKEISELP